MRSLVSCVTLLSVLSVACTATPSEKRMVIQEQPVRPQPPSVVIRTVPVPVQGANTVIREKHVTIVNRYIQQPPDTRRGGKNILLNKKSLQNSQTTTGAQKTQEIKKAQVRPK